MSRRLLWQREIARTAFDVGMRPVKATLLSIVPLMTVDGRLEVWRDQMIDAAGVPSRTIDRHLEKAVTAGWLRRVTAGGYKRRAVYVVTVPTSSSCAPQMARSEVILCATCYAQDCKSCAPRGGELKEDRASVSEHLAVQNHNPTPAVVSNRPTLVNRYGQLHSTRQAGMHLARMVGAPPAHGSAQRHELTARLRAAGLSPRPRAFGWTTGVAA